MTWTSRLAERLPLPDAVTAFGIRHFVAKTRRRLCADNTVTDAKFAVEMAARPIATFVEDANAQHYELPPEFFGLILGPRRKYSCCLFRNTQDTLENAENFALDQTVLHADIHDGMEILELGCGWGSLSLWMAERFPSAQITSVSNSGPQREYIETEARRRELSNLQIVTADMNSFVPLRRFDRVVSVEMFEHMSNWPVLLDRISSWLKPEGILFLHVFSHRQVPYWFDHTDKGDWIAQHFFTGGVMPSHALIHKIDRSFRVEDEWRWNGENYRLTALHWLKNYDANAAPIYQILTNVYQEDAALWRRRWRLFFLATAGLFGDTAGTEWGVSHYRLAPKQTQNAAGSARVP